MEFPPETKRYCYQTIVFFEFGYIHKNITQKKCVRQRKIIKITGKSYIKRRQVNP